MMSDIKILIIE